MGPSDTNGPRENKRIPAIHEIPHSAESGSMMIPAAADFQSRCGDMAADRHFA
jgi:hypothetical protein